MKSETSWFKKELLKQNLRSVGWIGIVYFLGLFFVLPLQLYMKYSNNVWHLYTEEVRLFSYEFEFQIYLVMIIPVLMGIFLFRYLQVKQSSDFIHSLPMKRAQLFNQNIVVGILVLVIPIILNTVIIHLLYAALSLQQYFPVSEIYSWMGITLLFTLFLFFFTVFIGMVTAQSVVQGVLTFIFLIFPTGISALVLFNLENFLYGFPFDYYSSLKIERLSPLLRIEQLNRDLLSTQEIIIYVGLSLLFYILSLVIYKKRKLEAVSQAIAFVQLKPIFKYGVIFCTMLLGSVYFGELQDSLGWIIFGYVFGSLLGYFIAEMVLQKTWRVFRLGKGYFIYCAFSIILIASISLDVFDYGKKMPALEEIESVYMTDQPYLYYQLGNNEERMFNDRPPLQPFTSDETIKNIYELQQQLVQDKGKLKQQNLRNIHVNRNLFVYQLKNGDTYVREYKVPVTEDYSKFLAPIMESEEYKGNTYPVLKMDDSSVDRISLSALGPAREEVVIADPAEIQEVLDLVKDDIMALSYEDMIDARAKWSIMEVLMEGDNRYPGNSYHHEWGRAYPKLQKWVSEHGYLEKVTITGEDVKYAIIAKLDNEEKDVVIRSFSHDSMLKKLENNPNAIKIEKKEELNQVLENTSHFTDSADYIVALVFNKEQYIDIRSIDEEYAPEFLKEQFE